MCLCHCTWHCLMFASTGESSFEVKTEADSNDITEHPRDDKPRPYLCTVCDKRFTRKQSLNKHKRTHTGVMYTCSHCEKVLSSQDSLYQHMNIRTSKYKCSVCGKCFGTSKHLAVHKRSHSGEKLFECTVCSKRFSTSRHLVVHSRIHSGEKPYKCHLCNKAFNQSGNLERHMRVHTVTNHTNVHCVTKVSLHPAACSYINVMYTVTVDHMNVLSVGNCLRETWIWSCLLYTSDAADE